MRSRRLITIAGVCAVLTVVLGLVVAGGRTPTGVDDAAQAVVDGWPRAVLRALVVPTEPYVLVPVLALLALWCLHTSRPRDALVVALCPALAVAAGTWLCKPLFGRWKNDTLVYPSGHTVSVVATLVVTVLLAGGLVRVVIACAGAVLLAGVAAGMVGLGYHYLTDVVGGAFFAVFAVLTGYVLVTRPTTAPVTAGTGDNDHRSGL